MNFEFQQRIRFIRKNSKNKTTGKRERIAWNGLKNLQIVEYFIEEGKELGQRPPKQAAMVKNAAIAFVQALKRALRDNNVERIKQEVRKEVIYKGSDQIAIGS